VKVIADTNILVRAVVLDDPVQGPVAASLVTSAELVAVPLTSLCELCWVLRSVYRFSTGDIAAAIRLLVDSPNVALEHSAVEAGLALLEAGGDFADGVIAHMGKWLGGETFVSFDKKAVRLLEAHGQSARVPC
jgi:predicted nucleic-acid-binding protein